MEVRYYSSFDRAFWAGQALPLQIPIQSRVRQGISKFLDYLETRKIPHGLGLKKLKHGFWEIRVGLSYRVLFKIEAQTLHIVFVGTHEDIRQFLHS